MRSNYYGAYVMFKKESSRFITVWMQTLLSPIISNLLFLAIFGLSLNRSMPNIEGVSYLQFLVPGLVVMGMMTNAFQNPSSSIIIAKYNDTIRDLLMIPLTITNILWAYIFSSVLRGVLVGAITLITSLFFVDMPFENIGLIILATLLINIVFALLGVLAGIWATEFDRIAGITNFVITPLIYLGGVFYSISILPPTFQKITALNPFSYMIDLIRAGFIGQSNFRLTHSMLFISATIVLLYGLSYYALKSGYKIKS